MTGALLIATSALVAAIAALVFAAAGIAYAKDRDGEPAILATIGAILLAASIASATIGVTLI